MNEEYSKKQRRLSLGDKFKFSCHKELPCFNTCCRDINIFLTPYDVLRMRRTLWLPSGEFLKRYTVTLITEEGLPAVLLKMMEEDKRCPFVSEDGCSIYQDRPWSCRMYPIFPVSSEEEGFLINEEPSCFGFREEREWTIAGWKEDQGIDLYDKMNELYKEITFHEFFRSVNKFDREKAKVLYMACYDLNEFRRFLFETRFFDIYDVEKEVIEKIKEDEEALLSFGYRWVRFNLLWEDTLRLRNKAMDKLLRAKSERINPC